jgi:hypothetical protein
MRVTITFVATAFHGRFRSILACAAATLSVFAAVIATAARRCLVLVGFHASGFSVLPAAAGGIFTVMLAARHAFFPIGLRVMLATRHAVLAMSFHPMAAGHRVLRLAGCGFVLRCCLWGGGLCPGGEGEDEKKGDQFDFHGKSPCIQDG